MWQSYWNFAWPAVFFFKVTPIEYLCKICCWYHTLNDSYSYLLRYYGFEVFYLILSVLLFQGDANGSDALFWIGLHKATDGQWEWASNRKLIISRGTQPNQATAWAKSTVVTYWRVKPCMTAPWINAWDLCARYDWDMKDMIIIVVVVVVERDSSKDI